MHTLMTVNIAQIITNTKVCIYTTEHLGIENFRRVLDTFWHYRAKWKMIGIELHIDMGTLETIEKDNRKCEDCLIELIKVWLRGTKASFGAMSTVLQSSHIAGEETSVPGKSPK